MAEIMARPGTESPNQSDARWRLQDAVRLCEDIDESLRLHVLERKKPIHRTKDEGWGMKALSSLILAFHRFIVITAA